MGESNNLYLNNIHIVGDRVLVSPITQKKSPGGLYLPPTVKENEPVLSGKIVKIGPGYPIPVLQDHDEFYSEKKESVKYIPLQAHIGDIALFMQNRATEIEYAGEKFMVIDHSSILLLIRDDLAELGL